MIKPILKIEMPQEMSYEDFYKVCEDMKKATANEDYHVLVIKGKSDYISIEIVTANDVNIHKP